MRTLIDEAELQEGVGRLAQIITDEYRGKQLTIVGILQDSIVLLADLMRRLEIPSQMRIIHSRTAHFGPSQPTALDIDEHTGTVVTNRHVLVVDDVLDTGLSLLELICELDNLDPHSIRSAVLLRKEGETKPVMEPDHVIFKIPDEVVVGYGLDYRGAFRHLPYIAALEPEELHSRRIGHLDEVRVQPEQSAGRAQH